MGPLVVDANILFSAALRDGSTRGLILRGRLNLHAPEWLWAELADNRDMLVSRSGMSPEAFDLLVVLLREHIRTVPRATTKQFRLEALRRVGEVEDAPYVATALAIGGALWSHDKRLAAKAGVEVVTTKELLERERPSFP